MAVAGLAVVLLVGTFFMFNRSGPPPDTVVNDFLEAVEKQDQVGALEFVAPYERDVLIDYAPRIMDILQRDRSTKGRIKSTDNALENMEFNFDRMKYDTRIDGDKAEVEIQDGHASVKSIYGNTKQYALPEEIEKDGGPTAKVYLVNVDGKWYISITRTLSEGYLEVIERHVDNYGYY
jgi:hypothetical protein